MNRHERRVLQTLLNVYNIEDVQAYYVYLDYLYSLADRKLKEIIEEWSTRFYLESGNDPDWWNKEIGPGEYQNLKAISDQAQFQVQSGDFKTFEKLFTITQLNRYEALERQLALERIEISTNEIARLNKVLPKVYERQYQQHVFNIGKEIGTFKIDFNRFDSNELSILAAKNFPDGRSYKDIVFAHNQEMLPHRVRKLVEEKVRILSQGVVTGASPLQMGTELSEISDMSKREAVTLMNDELGLLNSESNLRGYEELGIKKYIYLATLETHTCSICRELDHKEFNVEDAVTGLNFPLIHSHCRCTTKAKTIFSDESDVRWNRVDGKGSFVTGNLSFDEWLKRVYYQV